MGRVFQESTRLQIILDIEAALAFAHARVGNISVEDSEKIAKTATIEIITIKRIKKIEIETKHEVVALVKALAECCGNSGAYVHLGATSSDITDTATAIQLKQALEIIQKKLGNLEDVFETQIAESGKQLIAKNKGSRIEDTARVISWKQEFCRHSDRLKSCENRVVVGKMSGAVGTQAAFGSHANEIQSAVMEKLGIRPAEISTQIIQRDRYAELVCVLSLISASLENIAIQISMGKKAINESRRAPILNVLSKQPIVDGSTTLVDLSRIVRSCVAPALEDIITWQERDLTQSSTERFIIPQACILVDYMLETAKNLLASQG